jgi:hypothetical protein
MCGIQARWTIPATLCRWGPPDLAWSFNRDGEVNPCLMRERDRSMTIDTEERRRQRTTLVSCAHPQDGVNVLRSAFPGSVPVAGVIDKTDAATLKAASEE